MNFFEWADIDDLIISAGREAYSIWVRYTDSMPQPWWDDLPDNEKCAWRAIARTLMLRGMKLQKAEDDKRVPQDPARRGERE